MTPNEISVPILTYHSLDSSGSVISTSPEKFREQMKGLSQSNTQVITLREIASCLRERRNLPSDSVALTFDDGFQSVYDVALPVLQEYGFPATVFLVTDFCGKNNQWYGQSGRIPTFDLLSWDQILEMAKRNVEFGVHSATHPDLTRIPKGKIADEILGARDKIRERLGHSETAFAYPYGKYSDEAGRIIESNFYAACSTEMDFASAESNLHFLPRIDMYYFSSNNFLSTIGTASFRRFVHLRKILRGLKRMMMGD